MAAVEDADLSRRVSSRRRSKSMEIMQTSIPSADDDLQGAESEDEEVPTVGLAKVAIKPTSEPVSFVSPAFPKGIDDYTKSKEVLLSNKGLTDSDAVALAGILEANVVTKMVLANNGIGDVAASKIGFELKKNSSLTYLSLHKNSIGAAGITDLAEGLRANKGLQTLFLTGNPIPAVAEKMLSDANKDRATPIPKGLNGIVTDNGMC